MSIGMTYDEFWNQDVALVRAYRKAQDLRERRQNQAAWLQGLYIYEALCDVSPLFRFTMKSGTIEPLPYLKEPYPISEEERQEREQQKIREMEERMKADFAALAERMRKKMPKEAHPDTKGGEINEYHD